MQAPRWQQRLQNLARAVALLQEPLLRATPLSQLEQEGVVQRFEVALELAWKTLRDFLEHEGTQIDPVTPRNTIKEAFAAKLLPEGQVWIDMIAHRNLLAHTYDQAVFAETFKAIATSYLPALQELCAKLTLAMSHEP